ncbi:MAG TPA: response regulator [Actinomycetota bacterium]|nr:response regulator [Actinomycetota bacterium]
MQAPSPARQREDGSARPVRVLVVDDNAGFRESLLALLATDEMVVVGEADCGLRALDLVPELRPDVVLMDVRMPSMDGIETTRQLKQRHPTVGVVALTGHEDQDVVRDMLVAGASGYVLKDSDGQQILDAVLEAVHGGAVISPAVTPSVIEELTEALARERRRAWELEQANDALVERATRRHEMVARLGHELRTPVTVILGMAQILSKGTPSSDERDELLSRLVARATSLARLVERLEVTTAAGLTEAVDLAAIAAEVGADSGRVLVEADPRVPDVEVSPTVARRVLEELVDNALRFSGEGEPVTVAISRNGGGVEVRISDRGPGIPGDLRERIFEPLEQGEPLNVRTHGGVGLGLSVARAAARAMDGDVVLERTGPEGTTFLWMLPWS